MMRDGDGGRAGGDVRERADVDRAGGDARDEYVDGERDDKERDNEEQDDKERGEGASQIRCREPLPPQRGCKCPPVVEDKRSNRGERVGVEQDG